MSIEKDKKAFIKILEGKYKNREILLQFNPSEYSTSYISSYDTKSKKAQKLKQFQFKGSQESDIILDLLFDSMNEGKDVREKIKLLEIISVSDSEKHAPPSCMFVWGTFKVVAVITKITKKYTYFYQNGVPARVRVNLTLKPYKTTEEIVAENKKHSADLTKVRTTSQGDNIWLMADREYNNPKDWRVIASANDIDDPRVIDYGEKLIIPPRRQSVK